MCARYVVADEKLMNDIRDILTEIQERWDREPAEWHSGDIRPTDKAPVIIIGKSGLEGRHLTWGFPSPMGSGVIFNARRETIRAKPTFTGLVGSRRCVVPANGFYEWKPIAGSKKKDKYLIAPKGSPLMMAGLYNVYAKPDGQRYGAYTIITTDAVGEMIEIHDRMPLMLDEAAVQLWLDFDASPETIDGLKGIEELDIRRAG